MSDFFLGEIRLFSIAYAPASWAMCNGQSMPTQQNAALHALIGTTYGGDQANFKLPDLRGRAIIGSTHGGTFPPGVTSTYVNGLASAGGQETVTLAPATIPPHTHLVTATTNLGETANPTDAIFANAEGPSANYGLPSHLTALTANAIGSAGGGQAHPNIQPFLALNYCIATQGLFPPHP